MDYFDLLRHRKSTRRFTDRQLTEGELSALLQAAGGAPVGSNMYKDIHLTVVQDRAVMAALSEAAARRWADKQQMAALWGGEYKPTEELKRPVYDPFHGAPTVIFVSHRRQTVQPGIEFSNVACVALSMHLAATDMGLGSVLMWFVLESMREMPELDRTDLLRLPDGFDPLLGLAVGCPEKPLAPRALREDKIAVDRI